jgi:hypothetical protein
MWLFYDPWIFLQVISSTYEAQLGVAPGAKACRQGLRSKIFFFFATDALTEIHRGWCT